jgi:heptosyltransferase-2
VNSGTLIIKLGATGDVVRTTPLLRRLEGSVVWITSAGNQPLLSGLEGLSCGLRVLPWEERGSLSGQEFDLVINLEDDRETAEFLRQMRWRRLFGAHLDDEGRLSYTADSAGWFDLSLISVNGRQQADALKLANRRTYQDLIFEGLGYGFDGEEYVLPPTPWSGLRGDIAIAAEAGPVWPMKRWRHYDRLKSELEGRGLIVNDLPRRPTLLEHLADVRGHRCVLSGDSLPMHLGIGSGVAAVAIFNCTSPWEIYDYGILKKVVSPLLDEFFYSRESDERATGAVAFSDVLDAVLSAVDQSLRV